MPPQPISLRLIPYSAQNAQSQDKAGQGVGTLGKGQLAMVRIERFLATTVPHVLKVVEVDERGLSPTEVAAFEVTIRGRTFATVKRTDAAAEPAEGTPTFTVVFEGQNERHVVAVQNPRTAPEGRYFELWVSISDKAGTELYPAGAAVPFLRLDCGPVGARYARLSCEALNFAFNSAVVPHEALDVLWGAVDYCGTHAEARLLVLSHTDGVGSAADNDALSKARARTVLHLLRGGSGGDAAANRAGFTAVCKDRWATCDVEEFLRWANGMGWPASPEPLAPGTTPDRGGNPRALPEATRRALLQFDSRYRAHEQGGDYAEPTKAQVDALTTVPEAFWGQMCDLYQDHLAHLLKLSSRHALAPALKKVIYLDAASDDTKSIGCGMRYPLEKETPGKGSKKNRRTELLFFVGGSARPALQVDELGPLYDPQAWAVDQVKCPEQQKAPDFEFDLPKTNEVVYVIDTSGSMTACDGFTSTPDNSRLSRVKRAMEKLLGALPPESRINILAFSGPATAKDGEGPVRAWREALSPKDASALAWVKALEPGGSTPTGPALRQALTQTVGADGKPPARLTIVVLSDGMPDGVAGKTSDQVANDVLAEVKRLRAGPRAAWTIESWGFNNGDGGRSLGKFMELLATQNGGLFHPL